MASMIPKVTLFILSSNSITYGLFLSSSNLRTLNIIGCYSVGKRTGFFFFLSIFIWNWREGNILVQQQGKAQKHAITHLLHYELATDIQDRLPWYGRCIRSCVHYILMLTMQLQLFDSVSSCWSQPHQNKTVTTTYTFFIQNMATKSLQNPWTKFWY